MRPLLYLLSLALALPGVALAAAFAVLGAGISTQSWLGFFGVLLDTLAWLLPWGLLACTGVLLALLLAGLTSRFRWLASLCVAALAICSSVVVLVLGADNASPGQWGFFVPAIVSVSISVWMAVREWPGRDRALRAAR